MKTKSLLKLDWCSHAAAKYAVEHWHYSRSLPTPPLVKIGAWEAEKFIGCVVFSRGANNNLCKAYGVAITQVSELTRVALASHATATSRIVTIATRLLIAANPGLRLLVSYADPNHGHHGGIYQACGWIYDGDTGKDFAAIDHYGRRWHSRQVSATGVKRQYGSLRRVPRHSECTSFLYWGSIVTSIPSTPPCVLRFCRWPSRTRSAPEASRMHLASSQERAVQPRPRRFTRRSIDIFVRDAHTCVRDRAV